MRLLLLFLALGAERVSSTVPKRDQHERVVYTNPRSFCLLEGSCRHFHRTPRKFIGRRMVCLDLVTPRAYVSCLQERELRLLHELRLGALSRSVRVPGTSPDARSCRIQSPTSEWPGCGFPASCIP